MQIFQNIFGAIMHVMDCIVVHLYSGFTMRLSVIWRHSKQPNSGPHFFNSIFYQFEEG